MAKKKSGGKVIEFLKLLKDNKNVLLDMLVHPINTVKAEIKKMLASWLLIVLGIFFVMFAFAEYLPSITSLSKSGSFGIVGGALIFIALVVKGFRK